MSTAVYPVAAVNANAAAHANQLGDAGMMYRYPQRNPFGYHYHAMPEPKELSTGRWTPEEHRVFLQALAEQRGPAWSEIARKIRTRTATQVRTHAQKFFTKLARRNQTWPHFEDLIEKERVRLVSQRGLSANGTPKSSLPLLRTNRVAPARRTVRAMSTPTTSVHSDTDASPVPPSSAAMATSAGQPQWPVNGPSRSQSWSGAWPLGRADDYSPQPMTLDFGLTHAMGSAYDYQKQEEELAAFACDALLPEPWTRAGGFPLAEDDDLTTALTEADAVLAAAAAGASHDAHAHQPRMYNAAMGVADQ